MEDPWAACRDEPDVWITNGPVDRIYGNEEDVYSDSDDERDTVFQDMQLFLHAIGEPQLVDLFLRNKVTLGQLLEFNEQDLINCGVELVGDRKKILENIAQMHSEKWQPSSLHDFSSKSLLSSPGLYVALNDINKHIEYIGITFIFLKRRLKERPNILELGKDYVGVSKISQEIEDLIKTSRKTLHQLRSLNNEVSKHLEKPHMKPANHIDMNYVLQAKFCQRCAPILITVVTIFASLKLGLMFLNRR